MSSGGVAAEREGAELLVLVGGESTGKSTLVKALTATLPAIEVPEALREWVSNHGRVPSETEQREVMVAHAERERQALEQADRQGMAWVVSDGGAIMTAVYSVLYYGDDSLLAEALEEARQARLIVWCDDDIPWEADAGQRDGPDHRTAGQRIISEVLGTSSLRWVKVSGDVEERVDAVIDAVGALDQVRPSPS